MTAPAHQELTQLRAEAATAKVTSAGIWLFLTGALFFGSSYKAMRFSLGPMYVHPALFLIVPAFFVALPKLNQLRTKIVPAAGLFLIVFATTATVYSTFTPWLSVFVKIGAMFACVLVGALLPKTVADIQAGAAGMGIAACMMGIRVLTTTGTTMGGTTFIEMGSKNQYSLFALPPLVLMGYFVLGYKGARTLKLAYTGAIVVLLGTILVSGNRSGWAAGGLALLALYVLSGAGAKVKGWFFGAVAVIGVYYMVMSTGADVVQERVDLTQTGYKSDDKRKELFVQSIKLGMENPILGVGPERLKVLLTRRIPSGTTYRAVSPHNLTAYVVGGLGLVGVLSLAWFLSTLWKTPKPRVLGRRFIMSPTAFIRVAIVLFLFRGQFTEAILWSLPFGLLLGLSVALARVADVGTAAEA